MGSPRLLAICPSKLPHLANSLRPSQMAKSPNSLLGNILLGMQTRITPLVIWMASCVPAHEKDNWFQSNKGWSTRMLSIAFSWITLGRTTSYDTLNFQVLRGKPFLAHFNLKLLPNHNYTLHNKLQYCPYIHSDSTITGPNTSHTRSFFQRYIYHHISAIPSHSQNGQTGQPLCKRINWYKSNIKNQNNSIPSGTLQVIPLLT